MRMLDKEKLKTALSSLMEDEIANRRVRGAHFAVMQNGEPAFNGVFGEKSPGEALTPDCVYRIASMTKPVTALAFLLECAAGRLRPEDRLCDYLPEYEHMKVARPTPDGYEITGEAKTPILMWHLLSHVSGIGCDDLGNRLFDELPAGDKRSLASVADAMSRVPLAFEPMTRSAYSATAAFDVCARVIELTSGLPYERYLRERIFEPLGMKDTTFRPSEDQWDRMISMTDVDANGEFIVSDTVPGCVFESLAYPSAGAGLASTTDDYVKFVSFLLGDGALPDGGRLLPAEVLSLMRSPQVPAALMSKTETWGLGVRVITGDDHWLDKGTFGWSGAYGTHFWADPQNRVVAVYMRNGRNITDLSDGTNAMIRFERAVASSFDG